MVLAMLPPPFSRTECCMYAAAAVVLTHLLTILPNPCMALAIDRTLKVQSQQSVLFRTDQRVIRIKIEPGGCIWSDLKSIDLSHLHDTANRHSSVIEDSCYELVISPNSKISIARGTKNLQLPLFEWGLSRSGSHPCDSLDFDMTFYRVSALRYKEEGENTPRHAYQCVSRAFAETTSSMTKVFFIIIGITSAALLCCIICFGCLICRNARRGRSNANTAMLSGYNDQRHPNRSELRVMPMSSAPGSIANNRVRTASPSAPPLMMASADSDLPPPYEDLPDITPPPMYLDVRNPKMPTADTNF